MSKHYNRILELKLGLLEEPGEKTFVVPHVLLETKMDVYSNLVNNISHRHLLRGNKSQRMIFLE